MVVPEEDAQLALLHGGRELAQAVVGQLRGRAVEELLGHDAWRGRGGGKKNVREEFRQEGPELPD